MARGTAISAHRRHDDRRARDAARPEGRLRRLRLDHRRDGGGCHDGCMRQKFVTISSRCRNWSPDAAAWSVSLRVTVGYANYIDPAAAGRFSGAKTMQIEIYIGILIRAVTVSVGSWPSASCRGGSRQAVDVAARHWLNLSRCSACIRLGSSFVDCTRNRRLDIAV